MSEEAYAYSKLEITLITVYEPRERNILREHAPVYVLLDAINAAYNYQIDRKNHLYLHDDWSSQRLYDNDPYVDPTLEGLDMLKKILRTALSYGAVRTEIEPKLFKSTILFPYEYYSPDLEGALKSARANMREAGYGSNIYIDTVLTEGPL